MALSNQPYLPLYVQDFQTDEALIECSAEATGVYIRLLCVLHKSKDYGTFLLQQKDKQNSSSMLNFATKLARYMPYSIDVIERGLNELVENGVIHINNDKLLQNRMIRDNDISIKRKIAGSKGGFAKANGLPKKMANPENENEIEYENEYVIKNEKKEKIKKRKTQIELPFEVTPEMVEWAQAEGIENIRGETEQFVDHHKKLASIFADWKAAWRTWMRNSIKFNQSKKFKSSHDIEIDRLNELRIAK